MIVLGLILIRVSIHNQLNMSSVYLVYELLQHG
jgi:hypothetical protein